MSYIHEMKFNWNMDKNKWLSENRKVTFEEVICLIEEGCLLAVLKHKKKDQKIFVIARGGYAFNVSFVEESDGTCFLKTIYPSRESTRKYLGGEK